MLYDKYVLSVFFVFFKSIFKYKRQTFSFWDQEDAAESDIYVSSFVSKVGHTYHCFSLTYLQKKKKLIKPLVLCLLSFDKVAVMIIHGPKDGTRPSNSYHNLTILTIFCNIVTGLWKRSLIWLSIRANLFVALWKNNRGRGSDSRVNRNLNFVAEFFYFVAT